MNEQENCCKGHRKMNCGGPATVHCLGFIGAAVYFIQNADTFWAGVIGVLKAIVWPAFLVYKFLEYFKM